MKKYLKIFGICFLFVFLFFMTAFAGTWRQDNNGWWWDRGDGTWPSNGWEWCDGNNDGSAECYYFNPAGYCLINTITPDGYVVNSSGAWVINGAVQTKAVALGKAPVPPSKVYTDGLGYAVNAWGNEIYTYRGQVGYWMYIRSYSPVIDRGTYYEVPNCSITLDADGGSGDCLVVPVADNTTIYVRKNCTSSDGTTAEQVMRVYGKLYKGTWDNSPTIETCVGRFDADGYLVEGSWHPFD